DLTDPFAGYVRRALQPMVTRYGLEKKPGESQAISLLRPTLLTWMARDGRDAEALRVADALAKSYATDPGSVDPALAAVALGLHAMPADRAEYDRYRQALESAKVPAIRRNYLNALGWFQDPAIRDDALEYALSPGIRPNEMSAMPRVMQLGSEAGRA